VWERVRVLGVPGEWYRDGRRGGAKWMDKEAGDVCVEKLRALSLRRRALDGDVPTKAVILSHSRQHEGDPPFQNQVYPEHRLLWLGLRSMSGSFADPWHRTIDAVLAGAVCLLARPRSASPGPRGSAGSRPASWTPEPV
jgi:hypothetical protein